MACLPDFRLYRFCRRSLIILRHRCIQLRFRAVLLFSRDFRHPDTDSRPRKARSHSPGSNSYHTLIQPGTTVKPSVMSAEASAQGPIPARSGAVSAATPGASALRADSDDIKTGLSRPVFSYLQCITVIPLIHFLLRIVISL